MKIENFTEVDYKNALDISKRGKIISRILSTIVSGLIGWAIAGIITSFYPDSDENYSTTRGVMLVFIGIGMFLCNFIYSPKSAIVRLSMFDVVPTDKELEQYKVYKEEKIKKKIEKVSEKISRLTNKKQELQAKL